MRNVRMRDAAAAGGHVLVIPESVLVSTMPPCLCETASSACADCARLMLLRREVLREFVEQ